MLVVLLTIIHVLVCLVLIGVVLLQTGKRADLAGAFGGGGSQTAFGARGAATFLSRATTVSAVIFMLTSFCLALLQNGQPSTGSVLDSVPVTGAPAAPGAPPVVPPATPPAEGAAPAPAPSPTPSGDPAPAGDGTSSAPAEGGAPPAAPAAATPGTGQPATGNSQPPSGQGN